jgi:pimeloyl-ACP methyl ester carboxylesterase
MNCRSCCTAILIAVISILCGIYFITTQPTPHATFKQIEDDGGHAVMLKDRVVEYFLFGDKNGVPVVFLHGAATTAKSCSIFDETAKKYGYRLISISLPGMGGTSPIYGRGYFDAVGDFLQVLHHLGYSNDTTFHGMSASYGTGHLAALAVTVPKRIRSLQFLCPFWPKMETFNPVQDPILKILSLPPIHRIYQFLILQLKLNFRNMLKSFAPKDFEDVEKNVPELLPLLEDEYRRSTKFHSEGTYETGHVSLNTGGEIYEKRKILQNFGNRVGIWYGLEDFLAPPFHAKYMMSLMKDAREFPLKDVGHIGILIDETIFFKEMKKNDDENIY